MPFCLQHISEIYLRQKKTNICLPYTIRDFTGKKNNLHFLCAKLYPILQLKP